MSGGTPLDVRLAVKGERPKLFHERSDREGGKNFGT
jgi:hypothetical protein